MLKWTHSNAVTLEKIGHDAAVAFDEARRSGNQEEFEQKYRYYNHVEQRDRFNDFSRARSPTCSCRAAGLSSAGEAVRWMNG